MAGTEVLSRRSLEAQRPALQMISWGVRINADAYIPSEDLQLACIINIAAL
jgi:hypothetical protein